MQQQAKRLLADETGERRVGREEGAAADAVDEEAQLGAVGIRRGQGHSATLLLLREA